MSFHSCRRWKFLQVRPLGRPPLESLSDSSIYLLRAKLNRGERMSREDKDWLCEAANNNTYFRSAVPLQGWRFDFYYYDLLFLTSRMPFL